MAEPAHHPQPGPVPPTQRSAFLARTWALLQKNWATAIRLRDRLRMSEETFNLVMAGAIGLLGGLTQLGYHAVEGLLQMLFLGLSGGNGATTLSRVAALPPWLRVVIPTVGGLAAGAVLQYGFRYLRTGGLTNLLEVVVAGDGRLQLRPALINAASSLLSLASGASVGREGLVIQLTATIASRLGQIPRWPPYRLRLMVACGAAAGLASGFNAPIAGAIFACQIVLGSFSMSLFAPVICASVIASVLSRSLHSMGQFYEVPTFDFTRLRDLPIFLLLGLTTGLVGGLFLKTLQAGESAARKLPLPLMIRLGIGGLGVGLISLIFPEVWGNGYDATNQILQMKEGPGLVGMLVGLLLAKFLATTLSVSSGTVGGIFTPTLFLGAALGSAFGAAIHALGWATPLPLGVFALVGMGGVLAATTHSPLLAILVAFELSLNHSLMPPIMLACAVSALVGRRLSSTSIYTEPLRRKGLESSTDPSRTSSPTSLRVGDLMLDPIPPVLESAPFKSITDRFLAGTNHFLPVVESQGILVGMIALQDLKEYLNMGDPLHGVIASDIMRPLPAVLTPDQRLLDVLPILISSELRNVPVVDTRAHGRLIGRLSRGETLSLISESLAPKGSSH